MAISPYHRQMIDPWLDSNPQASVQLGVRFAGYSIRISNTQHYQLCQLVLPTSDWRTIAAIAVAPSLVTEMADRSSRAWMRG
jgi:hypothetical protein